MKVRGNLELSGYIENAKLKGETSALPAFDANDAGTFFFDAVNNTLHFNDGLSNKSFKFDESADVTLRATLGPNWLNANLSFNPTPFNNLNNVDGLTGNSTLFDVFSQFDTVLSNVGVAAVENIGDVEFDTLAANNIILFNGTNFVNGTIDDVKDDLNISFEFLSDVDISENQDHDFVVYDPVATNFVNKKLTYVYENLSGTSSEYVVTHSLSSRYVHVTVIDMKTNRRVEDFGVEYQSDDSLKVTLKENVSVRVLVQAVPNVTVNS